MNRESLEALLEACFSDEEYRENREFNDHLDNSDSENKLTITLKEEDGTEYSISSISKALFHSDKEKYKQLLEKFKRDRKHTILEADQYTRNTQRFDSLQFLVKNKKVLPFIGAGVSAATGLKTWSNYLRDLATEAHLDMDEIYAKLEQGEHEVVIEEIIDKLGLTRFERDFPGEFNCLTEVNGPVKLLPYLASGCVITTNYDKIVEQAFEQAATPISEKVMGLESNGRFLRALAAGELYLLKLHGNIDNANLRILRKSEYDEAYGNAGLDLNLPLPKLLKHIFTSTTLLFLGCSLTNDRTLQIFKHVCDQHGHSSIPNHYAILPAPDDMDELDMRERFLADRNIHPIWYPSGEYDRLNDLLLLLVAEN